MGRSRPKNKKEFLIVSVPFAEHTVGARGGVPCQVRVLDGAHHTVSRYGVSRGKGKGKRGEGRGEGMRWKREMEEDEVGEDVASTASSPPQDEGGAE